MTPAPTADAAHLRLDGLHCEVCGRVTWPAPKAAYPAATPAHPALAAACSACGGAAMRRVPLSGEGTLLSWTNAMPPAGDAAESATRLLGLVELAEGPRLLCPLADAEGVEIRTGLPVRVMLRRGDTAAAGACYVLKAVPANGGA